MPINKNEVVLKKVRVSYLNCFNPRPTPDGKGMNYSVSCLIPMEDEDNMKRVKAAVDVARQKGIADGKFTKAQAKTSVRLPIRNGTKEHEAGDRGAEYKGMYFINANRKEEQGAPGVVDRQKNPIIDTDEIFSGCYCNVHIAFFPYNRAGNRGIGAGFQNIQLHSQGDRLDGRTAAKDAFDDYEEEETADETSPF